MQTVKYGYSENNPDILKVFAGEFKVTVWDYVERLEITSPAGKTTYYIGKEFNQTGLVLTAVYASGTTKDVTSDCTITGFDSSTAGVKNVIYTYTVTSVELEEVFEYQVSFEIIVIEEQEFSAELDTTDIALDYGTSEIITLRFNVPVGETVNVNYGTENTSVAILEDPVQYSDYMEFKVVPTGRGTTTLTFKVTCNGEVIEMICNVTVNKEVVNVESVTLDKTSITVSIGDTFSLTPIINPEDADDIVETGWGYESINQSGTMNVECLDVNTGTFSVIGEGTAIITYVVKTETREFTAQCNVTIIDEGSENPIALNSMESSSPFSKLSNSNKLITIK